MSLTGTVPEAAPAQQTDTAKLEEKLRIEGKARSGASWFYWLAGLSMVNSVIAATGASWNLIFGLGLTSYIAYAGSTAGTGGKIVSLVITAMVAGIFILFGVFANRRAKWAFLVGMALYALDGALGLLVGDWLLVGVHGLVLYWIWGGYTATQQLIAMESTVEGLAPPLMK